MQKTARQSTPDMPPSAEERARLIASRLRKAKQLASGEWQACSPLGDDEKPSFTLRAGADGRVLVYDHRPGVTFEQIQSAMESLILESGSTVLIPESITALGVRHVSRDFCIQKRRKKRRIYGSL